MIDPLYLDSFFQEMKKLASDSGSEPLIDPRIVRRIERRVHQSRVDDAVKTLQNSSSLKSHAEAAGMGAGVGTAALLTGTAAKAMTNAKKGRIREAVKAVGDLTRGDLVGSAASSAMFGGGLSLARQASDKRKAKELLRQEFIE